METRTRNQRLLLTTLLLGSVAGCMQLSHPLAGQESNGSQVAGASSSISSGPSSSASGAQSSSPSTSGSASSGYSPEWLVYLDNFKKYSHALCAKYAQCAELNGSLNTSLESCSDVEDMILESRAYGTDLYASLLGDFVFNGESLDGCEAELLSMPCRDSKHGLLSCSGVVPPRSSAAGGPCDLNSAYTLNDCADGLYCERRQPRESCARCSSLKNDGVGCQSSFECVSGYCDVCETNTCMSVPRVGVGESCRCWNDCRGFLQCVGPEGGKTCQRNALLGEPCRPTDESAELLPTCAQDLDCASTRDGWRCTRYLEDGAECSRHPAQSPHCKHSCVFPSANAPKGRCATVDSPPGIGQPCGTYRRVSGICRRDGVTFPEVQYESWEFGRFLNSCMCAAKRPPGSDCTWSRDCLDGFCVVDGAGKKTCASWIPEGGSCDSVTLCVTGYCEDGVCKWAECQ